MTNQTAAALAETPALEEVTAISTSLHEVAERRRAQEVVIATATEAIAELDREAADLRQRRAAIGARLIALVQAMVEVEADSAGLAKQIAPATTKRHRRRKGARKATGARKAAGPRRGQFDDHILRAVAAGPCSRAAAAYEIAKALDLDPKDGPQRVTARVATLIARGLLVSPGSTQGSAVNVIARPEDKAAAVALRRTLRSQLRRSA